MGVILLLVSLVSIGVAADLLIESAGAGDQTVTLLGMAFRLSLSEVVVGAFVLGALAASFLMLGSRSASRRWARRRQLKRRIATLETENAELRLHAESSGRSSEPAEAKRSA